MDVLALYALDAKAAEAGFGIQRYSEFLVQSQLAANVVQVGTNTPLDKIRIISRVAYISSAGAAQTIIAAGAFPQAVMLIGANQTIAATGDVRYEEPFYEGAGLASFGSARDCELVVMPGEQIKWQSNFSAGVNANAIQVWLHGYEIPRGNWRFG